MSFIFIFFTVFGFSLLETKASSSSKNTFYTSKSKHGSCNTCHVNGGSAGRWNFGTQQIDSEEGKIIPSLKGIGKRKSKDQIERAILHMKKLFNFKLTDDEIEQLVEYLATL